MGAFIVNFQVRSTDVSGLISALTSIIQQRAYVSDVKNGWISFYDEIAATQDADEIIRIGSRLSKQVSASVLAFLVHDSDILQYWLFSDGRVEDEYNSVPDYWDDPTDEERTRLRGRPDTLFQRLGLPSNGMLAAALHADDDAYVFAEERLAQVAAAINLDGERSSIDFRDLLNNECDPRTINAIQVKNPTAADRPDGPVLSPFGVESADDEEEDEDEDEDQDAGGAMGGMQFPGGTFPPRPAMPFQLSPAVDDRIRAKMRDKIVALSERASPIALRLAIAFETADLIPDIVARGADPNAAEADGRTPLFLAVESVISPDVVKCLLAHGADRNHRDHAGRTLVQIAKAIADSGKAPCRDASVASLSADALKQRAAAIVELLSSQ